MPALTEEQRAARRQQAEERKERRRADWEQEQADKQTAAEAMRDVLRHPDSTPAQKIFALEILDNLKFYDFIPYSGFTKTQTDEKAEEQRRAFKEEITRQHPEIMRAIEAGTQ